MVNSRNSIKAWNVASFELMNLPRASAAIMNSLLLVVACCMKQGSGPVEPIVDRTGKVPPEPRFVVDLEPWTRVFFHNLSDLFRTPQPGLELSSPPGDFWGDVFVAPHLPWRRFLESAFYHVAIIAALWGTAQFWPRPLIKDRATFSSRDVIYYSASEYLPPLDTRRAHI